MRATLGWMAVTVICCAAGAWGEEAPGAPGDAQLAQAQTELDEAKRLEEAGKYAEALPLAEHALQIRQKALGPGDPQVADCLSELGRLHWRRGDYVQAEPLQQRALQIREAVLGKNHPDVASSLNNLALLYQAQGAYGRAEPLYQRALQIREAALGNNHPDVARSLNNLANLYKDQGAYGRAEPLYQRALQIREAALGNNHPDVASSLDGLANLYLDQGAYERAEPLYQRALQIRETALESNHPYVARSLNNLANLYRGRGAYERAVPLHQRALQIWEAVLGKNHPDVASSLHNLAELYSAQGAYERAKPLYQRAIRIREAAQGNNRPYLAFSLNSLATLYKDQGAYERAEPLYQRALQIFEDALGKDHPYVAKPLNGLAVLYMHQGAYEQAEPLYQRALQIVETTLGKNHLDVASLVENIAILYVKQGAYERAEPLYQRALQIREAALGKNHPDVALSLNNLGSLYQDQGAFEQAEPLQQRAIQIRETTLGKNHPYVATSLTNLAILYMGEGAYERAEPLYQRALQISEATLGKNHPRVAEHFHYFALLKLFQRHLTSALPLFERSFSISEKRLRKEALSFSEVRLSSFLSLLQVQDEAIYNLLREQPSDAAVRHLALTVSLLHKGRSVDEIADISRAIYRNLGEADREAFQHLRALRTQLAELWLDGPGQLSPTAYQARLKALETQGDILESELAQRSSILRAQQQLPVSADVIARVAAALPPDGALIEIVAFAASPLTPPPGTHPSKIPSTPVYFALILLPNGDTRVAPLGPAAAIDKAVARLHDALSHRDVAYLVAAQDLYRLVFQPLAPLLGSQRQLFISPDGQLSLVPFAALHDGTRFLADAHELTYLTSGRDLLRRAADIEPSRSVVVYADPDFTHLQSAVPPTTSSSPPSTSPPGERSYALERFFAHPRADLTGRTWEPLPGTRAEAEMLRRLLPEAHLVTGASATKQAFLAVTSPGILHVATHGAFLEDPAAIPATRGVGTFGELPGAGRTQVPSGPLLRSVLAMAGASAPAAAANDAGTPSREDSLVTALEIAGMNLWGTQLVVLSACDTGRGDVKKIGQGIFGLRRAFTVAGAETVVTSLWKVDDMITRDLMEGFYQKLLAGQGRSHALWEAAKAVRAQHPHPYYWAPFIVVGNGAPLRGFDAMAQHSAPPAAPDVAQHQ